MRPACFSRIWFPILVVAFTTFSNGINCIIEFAQSNLLSALSLNSGRCPTVITPGFNLLDSQAGVPSSTPFVAYNFRKDYNYTRLSFLDMEQSEHDLLHNSRWNGIRYAKQCSLAVVRMGSSGAEGADRIVNELLHAKMVRPSKDYFLFTGADWAELARALTFFKDLKFKYGLVMRAGDKSFLTSTLPGQRGILSPDCKSILNGRHLQISAVYGPQMLRIHPVTKTKGPNTPSGGIYYDMLLAASQMHNFTFTVRTSGFNGASGFKRNGSWYGAVGEVFNRQADFTVTAGISEPRNHIVDPSATTCWIRRIFFIQRPPLATKWTAIFKPLSGFVWALTMAAVLVSLPIYFYCGRALRAHNRRAPSPKWSASCALFYRMALEQSYGREARGVRTRSIIAIWAAFWLVLTTSYRSQLINFLTFVTSEPVPTTHEQLIAEGYKLYFRYYGGIAYEYYRTSQVAVHQQLHKRAVLVNASYDCVVSAALSERSACLDYDVHGSYAVLTNATLYPFAATSPAAQLFVRSSDFSVPVIMPWCFRKGSPLLQCFDEFILQVLASGLYDHWLSQDWARSAVVGARWLRTQQNSPIAEQLETSFSNMAKSARALTLQSLMGLWFILLTGLGIALLSWVVEFGWSRHCLLLVTRSDWKDCSRVQAEL